MSTEEMDHAMARYAEGDDSAFVIVYDHLAPRLLAFVERQTRDSAWAEDFVQQAFLQIHRSRAHFRPGASVLPWAFAITRRLLIDQARRAPLRERSGEASEVEVVSPDPGPEAVVSARQLEQRLGEELAQLPANQRAAFMLIRAKELSTAEAAASLGISVAALKLRAHRAYQALQGALSELFDRPLRAE